VKIYQGLEEQRQIIDRLKRYKDVMYGIVVRRLAVLREELVAIFWSLLGEPVIIDGRVRERQRAQLPVAIDRRRGTDRREL
jgi:hypothetical protein